MSLASSIIAWCKGQDFWPVLRPLLEQDIGVVIHVPFPVPTELISDERLARRHLVAAFRSTHAGALVLIETCAAPMWHLQVLPKRPLEMRIDHDDRAPAPDRKPAHAEDWN